MIAAASAWLKWLKTFCCGFQIVGKYDIYFTSFGFVPLRLDILFSRGSKIRVKYLFEKRVKQPTIAAVTPLHAMVVQSSLIFANSYLYKIDRILQKRGSRGARVVLNNISVKGFDRLFFVIFR